MGVENSNQRSLYVKKSRFSESQIVALLKEVELGAKVGETCRKHGVSEPTLNSHPPNLSRPFVSL